MPQLDHQEPFSPTDGTRKQYTSAWTLVAQGFDGAVAFTHGLGEIPWACDVIESETSGGVSPIEPTSVTVAKTNTTITVTNSDSVDHYFQVRAM